MKATGPDGISSKLLNSTSHKVSPHLTRLFRWSIGHQTEYGSWKLARVSPIFKKDDRTNPAIGNYQLVSLLSVPSKLLESEINTAIVNNATSNNLITLSQWAYRKMDMDMKSFLKIVITCFTFSVFISTFHPHKKLTTDLRIFYISKVYFMIERFYSLVLITFNILFYL